MFSFDSLDTECCRIACSQNTGDTVFFNHGNKKIRLCICADTYRHKAWPFVLPESGFCRCACHIRFYGVAAERAFLIGIIIQPHIEMHIDTAQGTV